MTAGRVRNRRIGQPFEKIVSVAAPHKLIRINAQRPRAPTSRHPQLYRPRDYLGRFPTVPVSAILRTHASTNAEFLCPSGKGRDGTTHGTPAGVPVPLATAPLHGKCALAAGLAGRAILFDLFPLGGLLRRTWSQRGWRTLRVAVPGRWVYRRTWWSWRRSSGQRAHSRSRSARGG